MVFYPFFIQFIIFRLCVSTTCASSHSNKVFSTLCHVMFHQWLMTQHEKDSSSLFVSHTTLSSKIPHLQNSHNSFLSFLLMISSKIQYYPILITLVSALVAYQCRSEKNKKNIKRKRKRKLVKDDLVDMQGRMQQMKKPW